MECHPRMVVHCSIAYPFSENGICDSAKTDIPFGGMAYAIFRQCTDLCLFLISVDVFLLH